MTHDPILSVDHVQGWRLLAEFAAPSAPGSDRQLLDQVTDTVRGLPLPPLQQEKIHQAFVQAVARATPVGDPGPLCPLHLRIWLLGCCLSECGWGFFLVERGAASRNEGPETGHLVELFLYQECDS